MTVSARHDPSLFEKKLGWPKAGEPILDLVTSRSLISKIYDMMKVFSASNSTSKKPKTSIWCHLHTSCFSTENISDDVWSLERMDHKDCTVKTMNLFTYRNLLAQEGPSKEPRSSCQWSLLGNVPKRRSTKAVRLSKLFYENYAEWSLMHVFLLPFSLRDSHQRVPYWTGFLKPEVL